MIKGKVATIQLGRVGNQMIEAAVAKTYAKLTNREFVGMIPSNDKFDNNTALYGNIMRNVPMISDININEYVKYPYIKMGEWDKNIPEFNNNKNVLLNSYFQNVNFIDRDIAFELFSPRDEILSKIKKLYGDLSNTVSIHLRRTDYLSRACVYNGFKVLSDNDVHTIIDKYFSNDEIIFVSDDIEYCKNNFIGGQFRFADIEDDDRTEIDLYLQTQCKSNVISNSTFSWWGAYLNKNAEKVIIPWPWFKRRREKYNYLYVDGWIKFKN